MLFVPQSGDAGRQFFEHRLAARFELVGGRHLAQEVELGFEHVRCTTSPRQSLSLGKPRALRTEFEHERLDAE